MTRLKRKKDISTEHKLDARFGTPELVARYRAQRLATHKPDTIIDVGAGAGFQSRAFAAVAKTVIAIERDETRLQRANLPENVTTIVGDAMDPAVIARAKSLATGNVVVFLDPERPAASSQRTIREIEPPVEDFVAAYSAITPDIAIELPPFLTDIPVECEREFLSVDGKLNRLTVYLGGLRTCDRSVVRLPGGERVTSDMMPPRRHAGMFTPAYVLEPDAALVHADLVDVVIDVQARFETIGMIQSKRTVLVSPKRSTSPFFTQYEIVTSAQDVIMRRLPKLDCEAVIVHGAMDPRAQREMLRQLSQLCHGKKRLHLFLSTPWYLTKKLGSGTPIAVQKKEQE